VVKDIYFYCLFFFSILNIKAGDVHKKDRSLLWKN
jgi:hypothetical protein